MSTEGVPVEELAVDINHGILIHGDVPHDMRSKAQRSTLTFLLNAGEEGINRRRLVRRLWGGELGANSAFRDNLAIWEDAKFSQLALHVSKLRQYLKRSGVREWHIPRLGGDGRYRIIKFDQFKIFVQELDSHFDPLIRWINHSDLSNNKRLLGVEIVGRFKRQLIILRTTDEPSFEDYAALFNMLDQFGKDMPEKARIQFAEIMRHPSFNVILGVTLGTFLSAVLA